MSECIQPALCVVPSWSLLTTRQATATSLSRLAKLDPQDIADLTGNSQLGSDMVTITVARDDTAEKVVFHRQISCQKVEYFNKIFNSGFIEGAKQTTNLPEDDTDSFKLLAGWIYTSTLQIAPEFSGAEIVELVWSCRERYNTSALAGQIRNIMTQHLLSEKLMPSVAAISLSYRITHSKSKIQLLMARTLVFLTLHANFELIGGYWNNEALSDLIRDHGDLSLDMFAIMRLQAGKLQIDPRMEGLCGYHRHSKDEECPYNFDGGD